MAKYQISAPAFVGGKHYQADVRNPQTIELPDDEQPSRDWTPLDEAAISAQEKLFDYDKLDPKERANKAAEKAKAEKRQRFEEAKKAVRSSGAPTPAPAEKVSDKHGKRANDNSPV